MKKYVVISEKCLDAKEYEFHHLLNSVRKHYGVFIIDDVVIDFDEAKMDFFRKATKQKQASILKAILKGGK